VRLGSMLSAPRRASLQELAPISQACGAHLISKDPRKPSRRRWPNLFGGWQRRGDGGGDSVARWPAERPTLGRPASSSSVEALSARVAPRIPAGVGGAARVACAAA